MDRNEYIKLWMREYRKTEKYKQGREHRNELKRIKSSTEEGKEKRRLYKRKYFNKKHPVGLLRELYRAQIKRSKKKGWPKPEYKARYLIDTFLHTLLYRKLYNNWRNNNFKPELKPTIDRINFKLPYTKDNIQLMTVEENQVKEYTQEINKPVIMCDPETGEELREFISIAEANRIIGVTTIGIRCKDFKTAGGYTWKYKGEGIIKKEIKEIIIRKGNNTRKVKQIDPSTGEIIQIFNTQLEAELKTGIHRSGISACCRKKPSRIYAGGFKWEYA